jgi:hypothetical protein
LERLNPTTAFFGPMYIGTDALGRPLTNGESRELAALLRKHDFVGASMIALNFAFKRTRNKAAAQDLLGRAQQRLVSQGWNPSAVTLAKCLCRFVWSEHTHQKREDATRRKAEEGFLREQGIDHSASPSAEDYALRLAEEQEEEDRARRRTEQLRAAFTQAGDTINLIWLDYYMRGVEEPGVMAQRSGHDVTEFYRAADRRKRLADRLLAADNGDTSEEKK